MKVQILRRSCGVLILAVVLIAAFPRLHASPGPLDREPVYNGRPLHEWVIATLDLDSDLSGTPLAIEAIKAVQAIGPDAAVPWLVKWLKPPHYDSRLPFAAANCFQIFGSRANAAVPELTSILYMQGQLPEIYSAREQAAEALGYLGPKAVPVLLSAATNSSLESYRFHILISLGCCSSNSPDVIPALIQWTHDPDAYTRLDAFVALTCATRQPGLVVPVLCAALRDTNGAIRDIAAGGLGNFGNASRDAVPELIKLLKDPKAARGAMFSLGKIGQPSEVILPLLVKKLHDRHWWARRVAAFALGDFGGQPAFKALMKMTGDRDVRVRLAVFQSLKKIDPEQLKQSGKQL